MLLINTQNEGQVCGAAENTIKQTVKIMIQQKEILLLPSSTKPATSAATTSA